MRNKEEVEKRTNQVLERYKSRFVEERIKRGFRSCAFNAALHPHGRPPLHYCRVLSRFEQNESCGSVEAFMTCDDDERAKSCPKFYRKQTEEEALEEFWSVVKNPAECGRQFPQLFALLWVLNDGRQDQEQPLLEPKKSLDEGSWWNWLRRKKLNTRA